MVDCLHIASDLPGVFCRGCLGLAVFVAKRSLSSNVFGGSRGCPLVWWQYGRPSLDQLLELLCSRCFPVYSQDGKHSASPTHAPLSNASERNQPKPIEYHTKPASRAQKTSDKRLKRSGDAYKKSSCKTASPTSAKGCSSPAVPGPLSTRPAVHLGDVFVKGEVVDDGCIMLVVLELHDLPMWSTLLEICWSRGPGHPGSMQTHQKLQATPSWEDDELQEISAFSWLNQTGDDLGFVCWECLFVKLQVDLLLDMLH